MPCAECFLVSLASILVRITLKRTWFEVEPDLATNLSNDRDAGQSAISLQFPYRPLCRTFLPLAAHAPMGGFSQSHLQ